MAKKVAAKKVTAKSLLARNKELVGAVITYLYALKYRTVAMAFHYDGTTPNAIKPALGDGKGTMSVGLANVQNLYHQVQTATSLGYTVEVTAGGESTQRVDFKVYKKAEIPVILQNLNM